MARLGQLATAGTRVCSSRARQNPDIVARFRPSGSGQSGKAYCRKSLTAGEVRIHLGNTVRALDGDAYLAPPVEAQAVRQDLELVHAPDQALAARWAHVLLRFAAAPVFREGLPDATSSPFLGSGA